MNSMIAGAADHLDHLLEDRDTYAVFPEHVLADSLGHLVTVLPNG